MNPNEHWRNESLGFAVLTANLRPIGTWRRML